MRPSQKLFFRLVALLVVAELISLTGVMTAPHDGFSRGSFVAILASTALLWASGAEQRWSLKHLSLLSLPLLATLLSRAGSGLTSALHPTTCDGAAYRFDVALGEPLGFVLGRAVQTWPLLGRAAGVLRAGDILLLCLCFVALTPLGRLRQERLLQEAWWAALAAFLVRQLCPVAGPAFLFPATFPQQAPPAELAPYLPEVLARSLRDGAPAISVAWALLVLWSARDLGKKARWGAAVGLVWIALAELASGRSYLVSLVLAVPIATLARALVTTAQEASTRRRVVFSMVGLLGLWVALLRGDTRSLTNAPLAVLLLGGTVGGAWAADVWLSRRRENERDAPPPLARASWSTLVLVLVFFCSGFAGLVYEVVFGKSLALTFGNTANASGVVLATYMGGMALGSWAGGALARRVRDAVRAYAACEAGVAFWCALAPVLFEVVRSVYIRFVSGWPPGHPVTSVAQAALGAAVILPATFLMGLTMPLLARGLLSRRADVGWVVGALYGANTLGAATGAFLTGYFLLPLLGVTGTTRLAVGLNLAVAMAGFALRSPRLHPRPQEEPAPTQEQPPATAAEARLGLAILAIGGAVTLALEVTYTHLLAIVAGNSAYAFSLMLFAFLIGLGGGAAAVRRWAPEAAGAGTLAVLELGLAVSILVGVWFWEAIPGYFASFAGYPTASTFAGRELVRFVACCVVMVPAAAFIGAVYPVALGCASRGHPASEATAIGRASALNTFGNIAGALGASFVFLPWLGSLRSLQVFALTSATLGLFALAMTRSRTPGFVLAALVLGLVVTQPKSFDLDRLASGANVYFESRSEERVIDHAESVSGGLTTVSLAKDEDGHPFRVMRTNGKFQGNDSPVRQMKAQYGFGLVPLLHTTRRSSALVIGFGVGGTCRVMRDAGFAHTDVVELSEDVLRLASKHFTRTSGEVLADPRVQAHVTDGRNFLLLQPARYDVISIEVTSIWFAGAASLYSREFYRLARQRLADHGVLQQWIQLHHLRTEDLLSIIATLRAEFPRVWLYLTGSQGQMVACSWDCDPSPATAAAVDAAPGLREALGLYGGSVTAWNKTLLDPGGVDRMLARWTSAHGPAEGLLSTDDNLRLEYATPRGNVLDFNLSFQRNVAFLRENTPLSLNARGRTPTRETSLPLLSVARPPRCCRAGCLACRS